jgi:hypothetical protein
MKAQSDTIGEQPGHSAGVCCSHGLFLLFLPAAWMSVARTDHRSKVSILGFQQLLAFWIISIFAKFDTPNSKRQTTFLITHHAFQRVSE